MHSPAILQTSFDQTHHLQSPQNNSTVQDSVNLFSVDEQENRGQTKQHTVNSERNSTEYHNRDKQEQILYNTTEFDDK